MPVLHLKVLFNSQSCSYGFRTPRKTNKQQQFTINIYSPAVFQCPALLLTSWIIQRRDLEIPLFVWKLFFYDNILCADFFHRLIEGVRLISISVSLLRNCWIFEHIFSPLFHRGDSFHSWETVLEKLNDVVTGPKYATMCVFLCVCVMLGSPIKEPVMSHSLKAEQRAVAKDKTDPLLSLSFSLLETASTRKDGNERISVSCGREG